MKKVSRSAISPISDNSDNCKTEKKVSSRKTKKSHNDSDSKQEKKSSKSKNNPESKKRSHSSRSNDTPVTKKSRSKENKLDLKNNEKSSSSSHRKTRSSRDIIESDNDRRLSRDHGHKNSLEETDQDTFNKKSKSTRDRDFKSHHSKDRNLPKNDYSELIGLLQRRSKSPISEDELELVCPALLNMSKMENKLKNPEIKNIDSPKKEDNDTGPMSEKKSFIIENIDESAENALTDNLMKDNSFSIEDWEEKMIELEKDRTSLLRIVSRIDFASNIINDQSEELINDIKKSYNSLKINDSITVEENVDKLPIVEELLKSSDILLNQKENKLLAIIPTLDVCSPDWIPEENFKVAKEIPLPSILQLGYRKSLLKIV